MIRKRDTEHAEGLWRIGDEIYDLTSWINEHPGGSYWLQITKGTDITELFETHHISEYPATLLSKFRVGHAKTARRYDYTFHPDGFYNRLKNRIRAKLAHVPKRVTLKSLLIMDSAVMVTLMLSVAAAARSSFAIATLAGLSLALSTICSHNFIHTRHNWRIYYFCLSSLSIKNWKITHILSHHMYTNTAEDLEITLFEPFFQWLPTNDKLWVAKRLSVYYSPVIYFFTTLKEVLERIIRNNHELSDLLVFVTPCLMYIFSRQPLGTVLVLWIWILMFCSLIFVFIGKTAGHHHPAVYHEGDQLRKDRDWGLHQIDAARDRIETTKRNTVLSLLTFGDHVLHHLFPTIDQSYLPYLYPELDSVCREFGIEYKMMPYWELVRGQFQQLSRTATKCDRTD